MKKTLLLLTPELPYPLQSGGKVKTWNMIKAFSEYWDITLVCPLKENDEDFVDAFMANTPVEHLISESVQVPRTAKNLLKSYLQRKPLNVVRTSSAFLQQQVLEIMNDYDLVLVDHFETFQFLPRDFFNKDADERGRDKPKPKLAYHAHNAYHQIWQRYGDTTPRFAEKVVCAIEAFRVKRYEKAICEISDLVFAAPNDIDKLKQLGCSERVKFAQTLHLGDDNNLYQPTLDIEQTKHKLCYVGFLGWEPNVQGLLWFLEQVWPSLIEVFPDLCFDIAGKAPDQRLIDAVKPLKGVQLLGFVEELETLYLESRVCICPLFFGSGIKVKVASSLARGLPVVTTYLGAEGLEVMDGEHLMIADTAEDTASSVITLLSNDVLWNRIAQNSRKLMREKYTWSSVFSTMFSALLPLYGADQDDFPKALLEKILNPQRRLDQAELLPCLQTDKSQSLPSPQNDALVCDDTVETKKPRLAETDFYAV